MEQQLPDQQPADSRQELAGTKIAVLFTDLKGSSAFYKTQGNVAGRIMIQKLNDMLFPIVRAYKGHVVKTIGDSIMAYFLTPKEALWAAIAMQKRLRTYNMENNRPRDQMLIRIAINYGYGIIEEKDVFGDVVNIAGKLIAICDAQEILVTELFYRAAQDVAEVPFARYDPGDAKKQIENVVIYRVGWEKVQQTSALPNRYLFSLRIEKTAQAGAAGDLQRIIPLINRTAIKIVNADETEVNALFETPQGCLATAQTTLQQYLALSAQDHELPHILKIGLHSVHKDQLADGAVPTLFSESIAARDQAGPYEIMITAEFYNDLTPDFKHGCLQARQGAHPQRTLYLFRGEGVDQQKTVFTPLLPDAGMDTRAEQCFYCGSTAHQAARCPSKLIRTTTSWLNTLGYLPLGKIGELFRDHFESAVQPLKAGSDEERHDLTLQDNRQDPAALCFFSFYETTELFQLRSLRQMYHHAKGEETTKPAGKSGALLMGEDCLRVSRLDEAATWFGKAIQEQPNDYRPQVLMGFLCIERGDLQQALNYFRTAVAFSLTAAQKRYIASLIARVYEVSGEPAYAYKEMEQVAGMHGDWSDGLYYFATLLVKTGKIKQALDIFRRLMYQSPRYYFIISLSFERTAAQPEIFAFLNRELITIRSRAQKSFDAIRKTIESNAPLFDRDDEEFKAAYMLYQKAVAILQEENIFGLMDIQGCEINVTLALQRALEFRTRVLRRRIYSLRTDLSRYQQYLDRFPYKQLLSTKDYRLGEQFKELLASTQKASDAVPPPSIQDIKLSLERLMQEAGRLVSNRNRLAIMKKTFFVVECSLRLVGVFCATVTTTAVLFIFVLALYRAYETSLSSLDAGQLIGFAKFGFFAGLVAGLLGGAFWFAKKFRAMYKKIEDDS